MVGPCGGEAVPGVEDALILSLFPGIGLLDRAFEEEGFCVVRGPDLLWGGDIKQFHPQAGVFEGIIGGPPCQIFSKLLWIAKAKGYRIGENLIPEFERIVAEAEPEWFLMENIKEAPIAAVAGYIVDPTVLNARWIGEVQSRAHRFCFGTLDGRPLVYDELVVFENLEWDQRVCASDWRRMCDPGKELRQERKRNGRLNDRPKRSLETCLTLQGLPTDFFKDSPLTKKGQQEMLGNGVSLPLGRVVAKAVKRATAQPRPWGYL